MNAAAMPAFREPNLFEKIFNKFFGLLVFLGIGLPHNYVLQVRGRKTGRIYSNPVNVLTVDRKKYLVAPRGRTQWVRNLEASGEVALVKMFRKRKFRVRSLAEAERPEFLKRYAKRFRPTVQRYFPISANADVAAFREIASSYPVFELLPA